jgi:hypothetical protein
MERCSVFECVDILSRIVQEIERWVCGCCAKSRVFADLGVVGEQNEYLNLAGPGDRQCDVHL